MDLFLDKKLTFEKLGMEARMGEDPKEWPTQILDELYRQVPFASDYSPKVVLRDVDADRRYAMGHVELFNKLAINPRDDATPDGSRGKKKILIPIIIKDGRLSPLDLIMSEGRVEPLTDERLRKALFRPSLFEAIRKRPGDMSMIEQLYPPDRQYGGSRGPIISDAGSGMTHTASVKWQPGKAYPGLTMAQTQRGIAAAKTHGHFPSGGSKAQQNAFIAENLAVDASDAAKWKGGAEKWGSAKPPLLMDAILPTIKKAHVDEVTSQLNEDPSLRTALLGNEAIVPFFSKLAQVEEKKGVSSHDMMKTAAAAVVPDVMQVSKIPGGFRIKTANSQAIIPNAEDVDRPTAIGALGGDLVSKVESDGTATITAHPAKKDTLHDIDIRVINSFGVYKVRRADDNKELVGWVFPKVMAFTGEVLPMAVFSNGSEGAMQENIAGVPVARQTDVIDAKPNGLGCFYFATSSGAQALVPVEVTSEVETPEGSAYICETVLGETCEISLVEGLQTVSEMGEGEYAIPSCCGFMPIPSKISLASDPDAFTKVAQAKSMATAVRVITDGKLFSFEGSQIDKLAGVMDTAFLGLDDAVFVAAILGEDPEMAKQAFATMRSKGQTEGWIDACPISTMKEKYADARKSAVSLLNKLPNLRVGLLKEAAPLEDPTSVDKILSVGFLNPENISIFCSYLPEIDEAINKLSELLVAARLGLSSVDEGALQKALVHLDKVVAGLRELGTTPQA